MKLETYQLIYKDNYGGPAIQYRADTIEDIDKGFQYIYNHDGVYLNPLCITSETTTIKVMFDDNPTINAHCWVEKWNELMQRYERVNVVYAVVLTYIEDSSLFGVFDSIEAANKAVMVTYPDYRNEIFNGEDQQSLEVMREFGWGLYLTIFPTSINSVLNKEI
jgi:hypothetical protein